MRAPASVGSENTLRLALARNRASEESRSDTPTEVIGIGPSKPPGPGSLAPVEAVIAVPAAAAAAPAESTKAGSKPTVDSHREIRDSSTNSSLRNGMLGLDVRASEPKEETDAEEREEDEDANEGA